MAPPKVIRSERYDVPEQFVDLARRRTEFLFRHIQFGDMPMKYIIASAYLQGMSDYADVMEAKGLLGDVGTGSKT